MQFQINYNTFWNAYELKYKERHNDLKSFKLFGLEFSNNI